MKHNTTTAAPAAATEETVRLVSTDIVHVSSQNTRQPTEKQVVASGLASSIEAQGQLTPGLARPHPDKPGHFELAAGACRLVACKKNGMPYRVIVRPMTDAELLDAILTENLQRTDPDPEAEAELIKIRLAEGITPGDIAARYGKSELWVKRCAASPSPKHVSHPNLMKPKLKELQAAVDKFNSLVNVGDQVDYHEVLGDGKPQRFATRTKAEILQGHTPVVWLAGKSGCVDIRHCVAFSPQPGESIPQTNTAPDHSKRRRITMTGFKAELVAQGVPREHFAVKCVHCGTVQSRQDFVAAGIYPTIEEAQRQWGYACIGRYTAAGKGCDWSLGGLFQIHTLEIDPEDGSAPFPCFEPASPEQAQLLMRTHHAQPAITHG